jgi:dGTPase
VNCLPLSFDGGGLQPGPLAVGGLAHDVDLLSFRIVTKIAAHSDRYDGLNLCRASLAAILKYPWHRQTTGHQKKKWGAYHSEQQDFEFARALHKGGKDELCIEAQVMTWADDITYSVHDIEDFYQAGLIPLNTSPPKGT